jgi:hypothetical protein
MSPLVHQALHVLQKRAYAQVLMELGRIQTPSKTGRAISNFNPVNRRIARCERDLLRLRQAMTPAQLSELKIVRALYLRMLLSSAPARLYAWGDQTPLRETPTSHLLEWLSHDLEQLELAQLEATMTPAERVVYLQVFSPSASFRL